MLEGYAMHGYPLTHDFLKLAFVHSFDAHEINEFLIVKASRVRKLLLAHILLFQILFVL